MKKEYRTTPTQGEGDPCVVPAILLSYIGVTADAGGVAGCA